ncbi:uncharacterized protein LOC122020969 [Zingiber officinale]|uniref:Pollen Ole e 1 allergen and extensin family protein n=1 Tax=Zingiber officinale TaxID=94328 RepID=A0A8J5F0W0_ZINOF|nr:uncharacterized protein LOC122020969 [Zingiber officinale]KAG6479347.1 hypothetical protein ZIOFF_062810 [Zingiber officinale]
MERLKDAFMSLFLACIILFVTEQDFLRSASATTLVTGTVYCDQCKDGERSFFDYPLSGATVAVTCGGSDGAATVYKEETNWFGSYSVYLDGSPDLGGCYARVVGAPAVCGAAAGPARGLTLLFRMFGMAMYAVEPLLSEPAKPTEACPRAATLWPVQPPPPPIRWVPTPLLPSPPPPAITFFEASACPYYKWTMVEYKCYWRMVSPDTRVAIAFGPVAAGRYGAETTLWEALQGRRDVYRTLLREGTTSLLNSYNSLSFYYPTLSVIDLMNRALLGSQQEVVLAALRFRRANSGAFGGDSIVACNFTPCPT